MVDLCKSYSSNTNDVEENAIMIDTRLVKDEGRAIDLCETFTDEGSKETSRFKVKGVRKADRAITCAEVSYEQY